MHVDWSKYSVVARSAGRTTWTRGVTSPDSWVRYTADNDLWFITGGRGVMTLSAGSVDLNAGVCLWLRPGANYVAEQVPDDPVSLIFVHFDLVDVADRTVRGFDEPLPPEALKVGRPAMIGALFERIEELLPMSGRETVPVDQQLQVDALLRCVAVELDALNADAPRPATFGNARYRQDVLMDLASQIDAKPWETGTVPELAARAGYSEAHFNRLFKEQFGKTPIQFILRARMNMSMRLLTSTSLRVREIARRVGYADQFLFHRQFKRYAGQTPASYRRDVAATLRGGAPKP